MDPATAKMLFQLGTYGPLGIMVILLFILLVRQQTDAKDIRAEGAAAVEGERAKGVVLQEKLLELSKESIKADTEKTETIRSMTKVLDSIDRRLA